MIYYKIKNIYGFQPYKWQMVNILNILKRNNIVIHTNISLGKNLLLFNK